MMSCNCRHTISPYEVCTQALTLVFAMLAYVSAIAMADETVNENRVYTIEDVGPVIPDEIVIRFDPTASVKLLTQRFKQRNHEPLLTAVTANNVLATPLPEQLFELEPIISATAAVDSALANLPGLADFLENNEPATRRVEREIRARIEEETIACSGGPLGLFYATLRPDTDLKSLKEELDQREDVIFAEYSPLMELAVPAANDSLFPRMWNLTTSKLSAAAWNGVQTAPGAVKVCVIDTGVKATHAELQNRLANAIDIYLGNGDTPHEDTNGHGTACAGIIAAARDNGTSIAGIAPAVIIPVNASYSSGSIVLVARYVDGIYHGVDNGAKVISMSFSTPRLKPLQQELDAVNYARTRDVILCAAAGNFDASADGNFPAAIPAVISVAAVDHLKRRVKAPPWNWASSYGNTVDICAPGQGDVGNTHDSILTLGVSSNTAYTNGFCGTSAATPHVAGLCALIWTIKPALTSDKVWENIRTTADDKVGRTTEDRLGWDRFHGFGLIDIDEAVAKSRL